MKSVYSFYPEIGKTGCLLLVAAAALFAPALCSASAFASEESVMGSDEPGRSSEETKVPPTLGDLQEIPGYVEKDEDESALPIDIRKEAIKEAALSYGARGGLAARSYQIRQSLDHRASYMDRVFDFRQLLIAAPSGLQLEPPIISESLNALLIENDGQTAAVSDAIYNINQNARIVSASRHWRQYLERGWGEVKEPPEILRPKNDEERKLWRELVEKGWQEGIAQADEVFEQDLLRLSADFSGMVRYRKLLAQGMVSPPFTQQIDRGVTGERASASVGGRSQPVTSTLRVGDRAVVITGVPELLTGSEEWRPASR